MADPLTSVLKVERRMMIRHNAFHNFIRRRYSPQIVFYVLYQLTTTKRGVAKLFSYTFFYFLFLEKSEFFYNTLIRDFAPISRSLN